MKLNNRVASAGYFWGIKMENTKKKGYVAGVICSIIALIFLIIGINEGWNLQGQIIGAFTLVFGLLAGGSFWKPNSIGHIADQILENISKNTQEQNKKEQKVDQVIHNYGNMDNKVNQRIK